MKKCERCEISSSDLIRFIVYVGVCCQAGRGNFQMQTLSPTALNDPQQFQNKTQIVLSWQIWWEWQIRVLVGILRQTINFASNLIFWVGMRWDIGHLAQNTINTPKTDLVLPCEVPSASLQGTWWCCPTRYPVQFDLYSLPHPILTQNMTFEAKLICLWRIPKS